MYKLRTCFSGNRCSLSTFAAMGFNSPSAKSLHVLYNNWCVSDKDDNEDIDLCMTPFNTDFIPRRDNQNLYRLNIISIDLTLITSNDCNENSKCKKKNETTNNSPELVNNEDNFELDILMFSIKKHRIVFARRRVPGQASV